MASQTVRAKPTETQRNLRSAGNMQLKVAKQQHHNALHETTHKGRTRVATAAMLAPIDIEKSRTIRRERNAEKIGTEGQIASIRTQQRIIQQKAAERERTRGYLIRHTGSRAITTTGQALSPSVNPITLVLFVSAGLIVFYLIVAHANSTNATLVNANNVVTALSSTKPLFVRETK